MPKSRIKSSLAVILISLSPLAYADKSITFNVPVTVEKLDPAEVTHVKTLCKIIGNAANSAISHTAYKDTALNQNGAFTGVIRITVNVPSTDIRKVEKWECKLFLVLTNAGVVMNLQDYVESGAVTMVSGDLLPQKQLGQK